MSAGKSSEKEKGWRSLDLTLLSRSVCADMLTIRALLPAASYSNPKGPYPLSHQASPGIHHSLAQDLGKDFDYTELDEGCLGCEPVAAIFCCSDVLSCLSPRKSTQVCPLHLAP